MGFPTPEEIRERILADDSQAMLQITALVDNAMKKRASTDYRIPLPAGYSEICVQKVCVDLSALGWKVGRGTNPGDSGDPRDRPYDYLEISMRAD